VKEKRGEQVLGSLLPVRRKVILKLEDTLQRVFEGFVGGSRICKEEREKHPAQKF